MLLGPRLQFKLIPAVLIAALILNSGCARNWRKNPVSEQNSSPKFESPQTESPSEQKHPPINNSPVHSSLPFDREPAEELTSDLAASETYANAKLPQDQTSDADPNILPTTMPSFSNFTSPQLWAKDSFLSSEVNQHLAISGGRGSASASVGEGSPHSGSGKGGSGSMASTGTPSASRPSSTGYLPPSSSAPDESQGLSSSGSVSDAPLSQSLATDSFAEASSVAAYSFATVTGAIDSSSNGSFSYGGYVQSPAIAERYQVSSTITKSVPHSTNAATSDTNSRTATSSNISSVNNTRGASSSIDPHPASFASSSAPSQVPEPSTMLLAAAGLAIVLGNRKRNSLT